MPDTRPWSIIRFAAYLLGIVVLIAMLETLIGITACMWIVVIQHRDNACPNVAANVREVISELLTGLLALIVASRKDRDP